MSENAPRRRRSLFSIWLATYLTEHVPPEHAPGTSWMALVLGTTTSMIDRFAKGAGLPTPTMAKRLFVAIGELGPDGREQAAEGARLYEAERRAYEERRGPLT